MSRVPLDQPLLPSVLDRLLDDAPTERREAPRSRTQVLRELKQSVRRDLENLLNTRRRAMPCPPQLAELERSLANYGLPDLIAAGFGSARQREEFRGLVERVIRDFEPRFKEVHVHLVDDSDPTERVLRFRIDGLLRVDPSPEPVLFDSAVEPTTGNVEIKST